MNVTDPEIWRQKIRNEFKPAAEKFYAGELKRNEYKGISGIFGSYAQAGDEKKQSMIRLRMTAGRITRPKLAFIADAIKKHKVNKIKFTTCQTVQLHNLALAPLLDIMEGALGVGIITIGGGGDNPRNVTCSPLSGLDRYEYFDVQPYAEAVGQYAMNFIKAGLLPRKLKIGFSSSPKNISHATIRDLGFVARPDGNFDVYSAGGVGPNPKVGIKVGEGVKPTDIFLYVKAMVNVFKEYGNFQNRAKARSRYIPEALGGAAKYRKAFKDKLKEVEAERKNGSTEFAFTVETPKIRKTGKSVINHPRALPQKQKGLYSVVYHPIGGTPDPQTFLKLAEAVAMINQAEIRLSPDETAYIVNLTGIEARKIIKLTAHDTATTTFEMASACIGAAICQSGVRDSQALIHKCVEAVRQAGLPDGALPPIHICGCPGSCSTPQLVAIGFRGAIRDKQSAFLLTINGQAVEGREVFGQELGLLFEKDIPQFLIDLGTAVAYTGLSYNEWISLNPDGVATIAAPYLP
ncbi:Ferredoxin-nitrite reductase [Anaerovibrio sp. JC8]|uniref:nitrite/sulfite reductase n=1 Tax=Anaerovibrio sp. JC8 TaxID=1240085 RepID=UPI000A0CC57E|nr:nitrite/sulfite reductase [Anaerovibrio sp. JC8]ORT99129.1 Ferredoxin-nitrite reductase [Anaerovibrio sp. JC8]